jgi:hypothetical protein
MVANRGDEQIRAHKDIAITSEQLNSLAAIANTPSFSFRPCCKGLVTGIAAMNVNCLFLLSTQYPKSVPLFVKSVISMAAACGGA